MICNLNAVFTSGYSYIKTPVVAPLKAMGKTTKAAAALSAQVLNSSLGTLGLIYANYLLLNASVEAMSKYIGQYQPLEGGEQKIFFNSKELGTFFKPLSETGNSWDISSVNFDKKNIADVQVMLDLIYDQIDDPLLLQAMSAQIITKVLVGKNAHFMEKGSKINIPAINPITGSKELVEYVVDKKFDLWCKVPAFGFKSSCGKFPSILCFRSTNTDFEEVDTLPTFVANLHPEGPGEKIFKNSKDEVSDWLQMQMAQTGLKNLTYGYSLGGVLASSFLTHYPELFSKDENSSSIILDAPGVSAQNRLIWEPSQNKPHVYSFVNRGDIIPKIGDFFIGKVFEVRIAQELEKFQAHRAMSFFAPQLKFVEISPECERRSRTRSVMSSVRKIAGYVFYNPCKLILGHIR